MMNSRKAELELLHSTYAGAIFEYGEENKLLNRLFEDFEQAIFIFKNKKDFLKIIKDPRIALKDKKCLLEEINGKTGFSEIFLNFMKLLINKKRFGILHGIFLKFRDMYDAHKKQAKIFLSSSVKLDKNQMDEIRNNLKKTFKKNLIIKEKIDKSLVGGIKIQFADRIYDGSVKRELECMREMVAG